MIVPLDILEVSVIDSSLLQSRLSINSIFRVQDVLVQAKKIDFVLECCLFPLASLNHNYLFIVNPLCLVEIVLLLIYSLRPSKKHVGGYGLSRVRLVAQFRVHMKVN